MLAPTSCDIFRPRNELENRTLTDPEEIEKALRLGNYIKKGMCQVDGIRQPSTLVHAETLALYSLRKYRHLKTMYPDLDPHHPNPLPSVTSNFKS